MDMPIPHVAAWDWANWKFPKPVVAGDTIYARWTLTQKRAPVGGSRTSIAVWRVDVSTERGEKSPETAEKSAISESEMVRRRVVHSPPRGRSSKEVSSSSAEYSRPVLGTRSPCPGVNLSQLYRKE